MVLEPTSVFDLYYVMVEVLFGSVLLSGLAMAFILTVICLLGRISLPTTVIWVGFFLVVFSIGYVGALALVIAFILGFVYLATAFVRYVFPDL